MKACRPGSRTRSRRRKGASLRIAALGSLLALFSLACGTGETDRRSSDLPPADESMAKKADPAEPAAEPFEGDPSPYAGRYEGPARGQRITATVAAEDGQLTINTGTGESATLSWLGGDEFADGRTRYRFIRGGDAGAAGAPFDELRMDVVSGHFVLRRMTP